MITKIVCFSWQEPEMGHHALFVTARENEWVILHRIIDWLNDNGDEGNALVYWHVHDVPEGMSADGGLNHEQAVEEIKTQSRYNETDVPGEFYGGVFNLLEEG